MKRKLRPDVVSGGSALALGDNFYLMKGKTHKQGGIDIGKNPKTGIEVENNEVVQVTPNNIRVFSAQPILGGISPAQALLYGGNPQHIFNAQETWKQVNRVTDDGKRFGPGGVYTPSKEIIDYIKKTEAFRDKWYKDGNGIDTIGYGFTGSEVKRLFPNGITREQADKYFADSIARRATILAKDTPNWDSLTQNQRDALLSYHYNVGEGSYRNKHKNLQAALTNKDWDKVIANMDAGYNDKKNPGLRKRRDYERDLFRSGSVTSLTGEEEDAFQNWYGHYSQAHRLNANPDAKEHYYDYRGYWKNRTKEDEQNELIFDSHLPDTYKLPGHPTFSTESKYSTRRTPGGTWQKIGLGPVYEEVFVDSPYTKKMKTYQNASYAYGGEKQNGQIEPSVITAKLPAKFKGSQAAARRYAEGYQFGKRIANERDKAVPYILAAANAPMLIEGLAVAPLATLGSIGGGYVGGNVGNKIGGPLGGAIGGLIGGGLGAGAGVGATAGLKQLGRYGNGVLDRTAEALIRLGDAARTPNEVLGQFLNKNTLKFIFNPKAKNLAYRMPYRYSGQSTELTDAFPGDVVDQFLGKSPVPNATYDYSILPEGMQRYIGKNYPNKRIPIRNLGNVSSKEIAIDWSPGTSTSNVKELLKGRNKNIKDFLEGKIVNTGATGQITDLNGNNLLDAGGFNAYITKTGKQINDQMQIGNLKGVDIWKFNPKDYSSRYDFLPTELIKKLGLKFIDSRGTPIVHTFNSEIPVFTGSVNYKYGGIHIKPSKRGTFTAAAKRHHMSVQEFARKVLNNRAQFSSAMVKKANFARNASKWHKKEFGGDMTRQYYITPNNIYKLGGNVRQKALFGTEEYERFIDSDGKMKYRIGNTVYSKDGFARATGMNHEQIDSYFDSVDNEGRGEITSSYVFADPTGLINPSVITADRNKPIINQKRTQLISQGDELNPSVVIADRIVKQKEIEPVDLKEDVPIKSSPNTIGLMDRLAQSYLYSPNEENIKSKLQQSVSDKTQQSSPVRLNINTTGKPTVQSVGFAQIRPYDGRPLTSQASGSASSSTGGQKRNPNSTRSYVPTVPTIPIDYNAIESDINNSNNRILTQSLNPDILTPITGKSVSPSVPISQEGLAGGTSTRPVPNNPYYSKVNVGLHKIGATIKDNPDLLGLGINWAGNLAASLINRSAIKGMKYPPAPIPLRAEKLPTKVNVNPQVSELKESAGYQEGLVKDNTASSAVSLARRQRIRNNASRQYQSLMGDKSNTELQLLTADKLNRQGVDAQNVGQYNQWRADAYNFRNKKREMLAENSVAGINNAAEAFAGPQGYLARKEARNQDILNMGLIAATSPNAQKVIGSKEFEEWLRSMGYRGRFSLLNKTFNV